MSIPTDQLLPHVAVVQVEVRLALPATHAVVLLLTTKWFSEPAMPIVSPASAVAFA
ncbi:hypothetical protein ABIF63_007364 [Bradyrhizobium japonicum]|uniref:Transposase n=1 Tax=Bradyrhizobium japonicum TaxID=375 RepID=A0ABV2S247_BRAJP